GTPLPVSRAGPSPRRIARPGCERDRSQDRDTHAIAVDTTAPWFRRNPAWFEAAVASPRNPEYAFAVEVRTAYACAAGPAYPKPTGYRVPYPGEAARQEEESTHDPREPSRRQDATLRAERHSRHAIDCRMDAVRTGCESGRAARRSSAQLPENNAVLLGCLAGHEPATPCSTDKRPRFMDVHQCAVCAWLRAFLSWVVHHVPWTCAPIWVKLVVHLSSKTTEQTVLRFPNPVGLWLVHFHSWCDGSD
ncbi:MAG: hypothetical protein K0S78_3531, partial [Thermomicrobiales bacterium]|nr:hypothetical protein [Thermomicrobiales bacterium]